MSKPSALILGGVGFIGRHLTTYLVEHEICSEIRVVDKVLPATAYLTARQSAAFQHVQFVQANLAHPASAEKAFRHDTPWTWVFNLAAETKYSQSDEIYQEKVHRLSMTVAKEAAKQGAGVFIELSTAQVYDADKKPSTEDGKLKPWTLIAKHKLKVEEELKGINGLNHAIVRPAIVYGIGDLSGITPRLVVAAVYKELKEEMKFLWTKELRINTVHVDDVVRALILIAGALERKSIPSGRIYNLCDKNDTDQEKVNVLLRSIFNIQTGFQGTIISNLARLNMTDVTEEINEKHLEPWSAICKRYDVTNTPLTPYLDQELLLNNSLCVDGSKIEQDLGFQYEKPIMTEQLLREIIDNFIEVGAFPKGFI
jgi:nucleoside-diphosphate-sugar epimerase